MPRPEKFTAVAARLRLLVESGAYSPGKPLPAEERLAAEFGVHRLTLRKAIDLLSREHVLRRQRGIGTFVAESAGKSQLPAVLYVGETGSHFYESFHRALCQEARCHGLAVTAVTPDADPQSQAALAALAAGHRRLICMEDCWPRLEPLLPDDIHVTRVSGFNSYRKLADDERPGYLIGADQYRAVKLAVEHLVRLGHRRIGLLEIAWEGAADPLLGVIDNRRETVLGYRAALQESGLTEPFIVAIPDSPTLVDWQPFETQSIRCHFDTWSTLPTAFVSTYDFRAAPLVKVLRERGLRVPEDVGVVGVGNTPWAEWIDPPLTSVCLGEAEMARLALVLNAEPEPPRPRLIRVDPELVVRRSTGPAPAAKPDRPDWSDRSDRSAPARAKRSMPTTKHEAPA